MTIHTVLESRWIFVVALCLGVVLSLPTLSNGLFLDDYEQRIALLSGDHSNVFDFSHRGTVTGEARIQKGVLPWWTPPGTKVMFYRPLAQRLMEVDYRLWPDNLTLMHLHSILWYGLAVLIACLAYRQILPSSWSAGLAAVLFALDGAHSAVAWLANRNVAPCMAAALLSLLCYRRGAWPWRIAGCGLLLVSLGFAETGIAITGYYLSYTLFVSEQSWRQRAVHFLPYALVVVAWLVFWKSHGFGASGPGFYIDPAAHPALFAREAIYRFPAYLVGQLFLPPPEFFSYLQSTAWRAHALGYALGIVALLAWMVLPLLRSSREARFLCCGMLLAVIPICSSTLVYRALWFVGFGATGLLALFIEQFRSLALPLWRVRSSAVLAGVMLIVHLGISPLQFLLYDNSLDMLDQLTDSRRVQLPDTETTDTHVLALSVSSYVNDISNPLLKDEALSLGSRPVRPAPTLARIRALSEGDGDYTLLRKGADILIATRAAGFTTLRPAPYGFTRGEHISLDDVDIVIRATSTGGVPTVIEYDFRPRALDSYRVIAWYQDHFSPALLPEVGRTLTIRACQPLPECFATPPG